MMTAEAVERPWRLLMISRAWAIPVAMRIVKAMAPPGYLTRLDMKLTSESVTVCTQPWQCMSLRPIATGNRRIREGAHRDNARPVSMQVAGREEHAVQNAYGGHGIHIISPHSPRAALPAFGCTGSAGLVVMGRQANESCCLHPPWAMSGHHRGILIIPKAGSVRYVCLRTWNG